jgi:hypothetical protein
MRERFEGLVYPIRRKAFRKVSSPFTKLLYPPKPDAPEALAFG